MKAEIDAAGFPNRVENISSNQFQSLQCVSPEFQIGHSNLVSFRKFIIGAVVQLTSGFLFANAAPLFEKEGDFGAVTLHADVPHPFGIH